MEDIREYLKESAEKINIEISEDKLQKFQIYLELLLETNKNVNLTAITEPKEVVMKHFVDSLALLSVFEMKKGAKLADVGTGAGFPGVPIKILRPDTELCLIDSLNKRLSFLNELCLKIGENAETVHARAEDCGRLVQYREKFDLATARAVAALAPLCEYCLPLVKPGGYFVAMKSLKAEEEINEARSAISVLGGEIEKTQTLCLSEEMTRTFIVIKKVKSTPDKYPRQRVKISKNPIH